jgi:hypothetical protein
VLAPGFDHDFGLSAREEPFEAQALVAELAVEALADAILPGLARIDQGGLGCACRKLHPAMLMVKPAQDGLSSEWSSRWMRGAPHSRLARLISRIRRRISPVSSADHRDCVTSSANTTGSPSDAIG